MSSADLHKLPSKDKQNAIKDEDEQQSEECERIPAEIVQVEIP